MLCLASPLDFGVLPKHPNEILRVRLDFLPNLARYREPGRLYRAGEAVRSRLPTGWAYRAQADGTTGYREPHWTSANGAITIDGSVLWETIPANYEALDIINAATWLFDDPSIIVLGVEWQGAELIMTVSGGDDGDDYQGTVTVVTITGQTIVGVFTIKARADQIQTCA